MRIGVQMKLGFEVEGRHLGMRTLFCNFVEFQQWAKVSKILSEYQDIEQVYISDHDNLIKLDGEDVYNLAKKYLVTVERTYVPQHVIYHPKIQVMLVVDSPSFWNLRLNDQIKFSRDLTVYSCSKRDLVRTMPEDFKGDIEV